MPRAGVFGRTSSFEEAKFDTHGGKYLISSRILWGQCLSYKVGLTVNHLVLRLVEDCCQLLLTSRCGDIHYNVNK